MPSSDRQNQFTTSRCVSVTSVLWGDIVTDMSGVLFNVLIMSNSQRDIPHVRLLADRSHLKDIDGDKPFCGVRWTFFSENEFQITIDELAWIQKFKIMFITH